MIKKNNIVYALGISSNGGLVILKDFLSKLNSKKVIILINEKIKLNKKNNWKIVKFKNTFFNKIKGEFYIKKFDEIDNNFFFFKWTASYFKL